MPSKQEQYEELKQVVLDMSEKMKDMSRQITELKEDKLR
jgi:hypothetical protein